MTSTKHNGEVEFRFYRAGATEVLLAADFTGWLDQAVLMRPEGNGWWVARVRLEPGEYRFRYVADGEWFTDYASHGVEFKKQQWNSVLLVNEPAGYAPRRALAA
jgi:1,4-alpha-glucan branching enzyme